MRKSVSFSLIIILLVGLPLGGVICSGRSAAAYLEFPPRTQYIEHAPFSWPVFIALTIIIVAVILPFVFRILKHQSLYQKETAARSFPWWGWGGLAFGVVVWILAWTRFEWFAPFQRYTFTPLWLAYIVVVNALTCRRVGRCLLTHQTRFFVWLFPLSAVFWWFFEYLNRFVQNWYYTASADLSGGQYFITATLPFATVLPAVLSTEEWLASNFRNTAGLENFLPIRLRQPQWIAALALLASAVGLFFLGWLPNLLFPLLWLAPLLLMVCWQHLVNRSSQFPELKRGDWRRTVRFCLAALICGFFWEMWNTYSLAKWIYTVPYVSRFHLFEMPILGYSGYLPFGLECAVISDLFFKHKESYEV